MRKNKMMRTASGLLVATLLTTSIISGTFAKYTTEASGNDTARVAKWGITVTASGNLYGKNYATGPESKPVTSDTASELSVMSSDTSKLVAPGTKSEHGLEFGLNGTPEVRTQVTVTAKAQDIYLAAGAYAVMNKVNVDAVNFEEMRSNGLYTKEGEEYTLVNKSTGAYTETTAYYALSDFVNVTENYYPVSYTDTNTDVNDTKITGIAKQIVNLNNNGTDSRDIDNTTAKVNYTATTEYNPGTDLTNIVKLGTNNISWKWKFTDGGTDAKDTILGDIMAGSDVVKCTGDNTDEVTAVTKLTTDSESIVHAGIEEVGSVKTSFEVNITATQVD